RSLRRPRRIREGPLGRAQDGQSRRSDGVQLSVEAIIAADVDDGTLFTSRLGGIMQGDGRGARAVECDSSSGREQGVQRAWRAAQWEHAHRALPPGVEIEVSLLLDCG